MKSFLRYFNLILIGLFAFNSSVQSQNNQIDIDSLKTYIAQNFVDFELNGLSVLVLKDDSIVLDWYQGKAGNNKDIEEQSVYNIASCTKAFTGAAMAQLVADGLIEWDDLVIDYLPDFKLTDPYITTHLTIEDLLCHRSGLGTFYGDLLWYETDRSRKEVIERLQYLPITNRFRDQFGYQNTTYMVAAEILEKVSGKSWEVYLQDLLFTPLGMSYTRANGEELSPEQAVAYPMIDGKEVNITMMHSHAAASLFSNTHDLALWAQMLLNQGILNGNTILNPVVVNDMMTARRIKSINGLRKMTGAQFNTYR